MLLRDREPFAVQFSASGIGTEAVTRASSPLADGATLRVLAFRRVGGSPDLQADEYMGEGTYKAAGGNGALTPVSSLLLRAGTYDFYALTPALAVTNPDGGGAGLSCAVSIGHDVDYTTSLTGQQTVVGASAPVLLNDLGRRCTKLIFELSPKAGNITSVGVESAGLTNMTHAPIEAALHTALPVAGVGQDDELTIAGSEFSAPDADLNTSAATVTLPREAGRFRFKMNVAFNGKAAAEFAADMPETLVFAPGTQYRFTMKMKGGSIQLILTVLPWGESVMGGQGDIGAFTPITIDVGSWENVTIPGETGGGNTTVSTGQWTPNPDLDAILGDYGLTSVGGEGLPWNPSQDVPGETGGGNANVGSGNWGGTENVPADTGDGKTGQDPDAV